MNRINVFVRRQRIKKLELWTMRAIFAEGFLLALFPAAASLAVFVGIVAWFLRLQLDSKFELRSLPFDVPIVIFIMLGAISVFISPVRDFELIYNYCGIVGVYGLTYVLVGQNVRTPAQIKILIQGLGASALLVVLWGYFQYIFGVDISDMKWVDGEAFPELRKRVFSTLENPNVLAGYLDVMICIALGLFAKISGKTPKILLLVGIAMMAACLAMTYSRGAFLTIAIIFFVYGILQDWRILILFAGLTGLIIYNDAAFLDRITSIFTTTGDSSEGLRIGIWVSTISMIADHPFIGVGWGAYKLVYPQYNYYLADTSNIIYHAHNLYLNMAAEVGIVGAMSFCWYFFGTMFMSLALGANKRIENMKQSAWANTKSAMEGNIKEKLVHVFLTSRFLQTLAQSKALFIVRMGDFANKILDFFSFTPSEEELRKSGKTDADITDEQLGRTRKNSAPELVHHEELKWGGRKKSGKNKDDDDKMDLQKFAAPLSIQDTQEEQEKNFVEGIRLGIGLAFLSMALNGMSDHLLFNIPSSILMWQLGALAGAIHLLEERNFDE